MAALSKLQQLRFTCVFTLSTAFPRKTGFVIAALYPISPHEPEREKKGKKALIIKYATRAKTEHDRRSHLAHTKQQKKGNDNVTVICNSYGNLQNGKKKKEKRASSYSVHVLTREGTGRTT